MITELINTLKYAPSGGNQQPWILKLVQNEATVSIAVYLDPNLQLEKQHTDHCGYGALISLGILSYSIEYLCQDFGYKVVNKSVHTETDLYRNFILINLEMRNPKPSQRPNIFRERFTDRRPFEAIPLADDLRKSLIDEQGSALRFFEKGHAFDFIDTMFRRLSLIRLQNKELFAELRHELKSDNTHSTGIPIANLGLSPLLSLVTKMQNGFPLRLPFAAAYSWPLNESISIPLNTSAAIAVLNVKGKNPHCWIELGEKFMNTWLTVTGAGARLQPFGNTLTIANYFQDPNFFNFSEEQKRTIVDLHSHALEKLNLETKDACLFFRIGYSNLAKQQTPRKNILTIS